MSVTSRASLLIVDDEPDMLEMLKFVLSAEGFDIVVAQSGEHAIEAVTSSPVDVVVTDLKMPGLSGIETLRALREIDPRVQVIVSTGYATTDTAEQVEALGGFGLIHKPFDVLNLLKMLRRAVAQRRDSGH